MTNRDDLQRDLQALLAVTDPSPAFAARVRTRVEEDGTRRSHRAAFVCALGGALCLASLAWALVVRKPAVASVPSAPAMISAAHPGPQGQPALTQPRARTDRPQSRGAARPGVPGPAPAVAEAIPVDAGDPRVLVPDDQRIALVHLLQRLHQGRATVPASVMPAYDEDGLLVPPEPIAIAPLPSPAPPDPDDAGGGKGDSRNVGKDKQQ